MARRGPQDAGVLRQIVLGDGRHDAPWARLGDPQTDLVADRQGSPDPLILAWTTAFALIAVVLAGCSATGEPSSSTADEATLAPSLPQPSVAGPTPEATASAAAEVCLPAEIIADIEGASEGIFDPITPLNEMADTVEALDFSQGNYDDPGFYELLRDDLVEKLRSADADSGGLYRAVAGFKFVLPEIAEC